MNHDGAHGLRVQLATALRERDMFQLCVKNREENAAKERESRDAEWRAVVKADRAALTAAESERDALRAALDGLVKRLDFVHADASYQAVWTLHQIHGGPYRGPTYTTALELARAALASGGDRG